MKTIATDNYYNINSFTIEENSRSSCFSIASCKVCIDLLEINKGFRFVINKSKTTIKGFYRTNLPINFIDWNLDLFFYRDINLSGNWNILLTRGLINVDKKTITFVVDGRDR